MKISHATPFTKISTHNGYGYATERVLSTLRTLGHEVSANNGRADVSFRFSAAEGWDRLNDDHQYKIGYFPWESTTFRPDQLENLNKCDEVWTPSPLVAEWFKKAGVVKPIYVYEHGVDRIWSPAHRHLDGEFKFLHIGSETLRKRADLTVEAFRKAFPERKNIRLTMKSSRNGNSIFVNGVYFFQKKISLEQLVRMFHNHHAFVYPSMGEGFGLMPLQAIATGMPTITVPDWAPYNRFLDESLNIPATLGPSPFSDKYHPGEMFNFEVDDIVDRMRHTVENYTSLHRNALSQTDQIFKEYDWTDLTAEAFDALEKRLENRK